MTTPTPRTDAVALDRDDSHRHPDCSDRIVGWTDYEALLNRSREIERDLAAAQEALAETDRLHASMLEGYETALAERDKAQDARQRAEALAKEAIAIAILLFDAWEDGTPCFETDGESGMGASIGNAFKLSDDDFTRCVEFLNRVDPRGTAIDAARDGK